MNCKPGDLAIVFRVTEPESSWALGRIVQCGRMEILRGRAGWYLVHALDQPDPSPFTWGWFADDCLRPIRGIEGDDETLTWAPVPGQKETVPA